MEHKTVKPKIDKMNCGKHLNLYIKSYEKTEWEGMWRDGEIFWNQNNIKDYCAAYLENS